MNANLAKNYKQINDILGLPQEYKGIKFYPLKIKDVEYKQKMYNLFAMPKNYIPNVSIIKASYIKFLLRVIRQQLLEADPEHDLIIDLVDFLCFVTHLDCPTNEEILHGIGSVHLKTTHDFPDKMGDIQEYGFHLFINDKEFSEQDFDDIREIILEQNDSSVEWVEEYKPDLEEKINFMKRNEPEISLKDIIYIFCCLTGESEQEVSEKTLFQFNARLEREMMVKNFLAFKPLESAGFISSKNKGEELFKHYFSHIERGGRYDSILVNLNKFMENSGLSDEESPVKFEK